MNDDLTRFLEEHAHSEKLVLAFSGGLDSTVLLHLLWRLQCKNVISEFQIIHVHHNLSQNADAWAEHCKETALSLGLYCEVAYADVDMGARKSLEQEARRARYQLLHDFSDKSAVFLTAQHQDDQAETFLLQLMRGAGPKGLSSMSGSTVLENGRRILRPLLNVSRSELENYAVEQGLKWVEDESNRDNQFSRNFLRNKAIPLLKERWPSVTQTISRSAYLCEEQQALIESAACEKLALVQTKDKRILSLNDLRLVSIPWVKQILRVWLRQQHVELPSVAIMQQIVAQVLDAKVDANVCIKWGRHQLRRYREKLYLLTESECAEEPYSARCWSGESRLVLENERNCELEISNAGFEWSRDKAIEIKFGCLSEKFKPFANRPSKPVKQWFKEFEIPPWERNRIPFFYWNQKLVQVGDSVNLMSCKSDKPGLYRITWKNTLEA